MALSRSPALLLLQPVVARGEHDVRLLVVGHFGDELLQQRARLLVPAEGHLDAGKAESRGRVLRTQPDRAFEVEPRVVVLLIALAQRAQLEVGVEVVRVGLQRAQELARRRVGVAVAINARPYMRPRRGQLGVELDGLLNSTTAAG